MRGAVLSTADGRGGSPGAARRRARGRRLPARFRAPPHHVPRRPGAPDRRRALRHRRRPAPRRVGGRPGGRHAGRTGRLVPGVAGALCRRHDRPLPAHHRARQARHHRRARRRAAVLQRGQRLPRLCRGHAARRARRAGGRVLAGLHARLPAPLRPRASRGRRRCRWGRTSGPATSRPAGPSPSWPRPAASTPPGWNGQWPSTIGTPATARTQPSAAARPPTTATRAIPAIGRTPASRRSSAGRSTRSRWSPAASAPSPG